MENLNLFKLNGRPARFFLHTSIREKGAIEALQRRIKRHGGVTVERDLDADVILYNPRRPGWENLPEAYSGSLNAERRKKWVLQMYFVNYCIRHGTFKRPGVHKRKMGGRPPGRQRVLFTAEDEQKLCEYLAIRIPYKESGGRKGNLIWKSLKAHYENLPEDYEWSLRHTWQSWREHYRKNEERLDALIEDKVAQQGVDNHTTFEFVRYGPNAVKQEEEEEEEEEADVDLHAVANLEEEMADRESELARYASDAVKEEEEEEEADADLHAAANLEEMNAYRDSEMPSSDSVSELDHDPPEEANDIEIQNIEDDDRNSLFDGSDQGEPAGAHIEDDVVFPEAIELVRKPSPARISPAVSTTYLKRPQASQTTLVGTQVSPASSPPRAIYPSLPVSFATLPNEISTPVPTPTGQQATPAKPSRWTTITNILTPYRWRSKPRPSNSTQFRQAKEVISESDAEDEDEDEMVDQLDEEPQSELAPKREPSPERIPPPPRHQIRSRSRLATVEPRTDVRNRQLMKTSQQTLPLAASKENMKIKEEDVFFTAGMRRPRSAVDEDDDAIRKKLQQALEKQKQPNLEMINRNNVTSPHSFTKKIKDIEKLGDVTRRNRLAIARQSRTQSPGYTSNATVKTPRRGSSSSGSDHFPLRGTRASAVKMAIAGSSYTPPLGTRAALASSSKRLKLQ